MNRISEVNNSSKIFDAHAIIRALEKHLAMIQFNTNGEVIWVNENFANTLGYTVNEMKHMMHEQFCTNDYKNSPEYRKLWGNLIKGEKFQEKIQRVGKKRNILWLEATYIPVLNSEGRVESALKIATDITDRENQDIEIVSELNHLSMNLGNLVVTTFKENIVALNNLKKQTELIHEVSKKYNIPLRKRIC
ncbi:PAS domain-containing protein [Bacillus sp. REN10]|uniref:PAS domain-containing protein n=1 Tax=Bacillus sp. REN10 TaxID=2782541 RepID=UPI001EEDD37E|nr:PAS domain-containing protein [Bacillus sp. REN10]